MYSLLSGGRLHRGEVRATGGAAAGGLPHRLRWSYLLPRHPAGIAGTGRIGVTEAFLMNIIWLSIIIPKNKKV